MRVVEYYRHCVHHGSKKLPKYNLKKLYIIDVDDLWPRKSLLLNTRITSHLSHDFIYYVLPVPNYHSRENNAFPHAIPALMNICRFLTKTSRVKLEIHFQSIINQSINQFFYLLKLDRNNKCNGTNGQLDCARDRPHYRNLRQFISLMTRLGRILNFWSR